MTGLHLAQYRIDAELGRGGMGIVYRATDTKLDRTVALKVLPASALASEDDRARFYREAKAAAQLHHPNIASVFQIDEAVPIEAGGEPRSGAEKRPFIAMEFIDGETLSARAARSPLKVAEVVGIAIQIAEALKAAHAKDIVHRDIKSANVMLTKDGVAKVLDFGLAKTQASTMLTRQGSTLGTVAYMSPEQARGLEVDGRSDLYSLGTVIYEMVAGRLPFAADYEQAVVYGILNEDPEPLTSLRTGVPMELERITFKLLSKDRDLRYQSASGLLADLKGIRKELESGSTPGSRLVSTMASRPALAAEPVGRRDGWLRDPRVLGLAALLLLAGLVLGRFALPTGTPDPPDRVPRRVSMAFEGLSEIQSPGLSPDGRYLVFSAMDSVGIENIFIYDFKRGTYSASYPLGGYLRPKFSPDGRWVVMSNIGVGLLSILLPDGEPRVITPEGEWGVWDTDESLLFRKERSIYRISANGGVPELVLSPDSTQGIDRVWPNVLLPGGRAMLISLAGAGVTNRDIAALDLESGVSRKLIGAAHAPSFVRSGHLVYLNGGGLNGPVVVQAFDPEGQRTLGQPVGLNLGTINWRDIAVSEEGTLVYVTNQQSSRYSRVFSLGRDGRWDGNSPVRLDGLWGASFSGSGQWVAGIIGDSRRDGSDVFVADFTAGRTPSRLTTSGIFNTSAWSRESDRVYYADVGQSGRVSTIRRVLADRSTGEETVVRLEDVAITGIDERPGTGALIVADDISDKLLSIDPATGTAEPLFDSPGIQVQPSVSPDGRFVAYAVLETESTKSRVVVQDIEGSGFTDVTPLGAAYESPTWAPDGRTLYVVSNRHDVVRIPVSLQPVFRVSGGPSVAIPLGRSANHVISVSPDGGRLLVSTVGAADRPSDVQIIFNFDAYARELAPGQ